MIVSSSVEVVKHEENENKRVCEHTRCIGPDCPSFRLARANSSCKDAIRSEILHRKEPEGSFRSWDIVSGRFSKVIKFERVTYGYIYLVTNTMNGRLYIGQHMYRGHKTIDTNYTGSGTYLIKAQKRLGYDKFSYEILEWCYSEEELNERELWWTLIFDVVETPLFYNVVYGGGSMSGYKMSESSKKKVSKANRGRRRSEEDRRKLSKAQKLALEKDPTLLDRRLAGWREYLKNHGGSMLGKDFSEEHRRHLSEAGRRYYSNHEVWNKGLRASEETKRKQSEALSGEKNPMYGRKHTDESKMKMSKSHVGYKPSDITLERQRISRQKKVTCVETGEVFNSISEFCEYMGVSFNLMQRYIRAGKAFKDGNHYIKESKSEYCNKGKPKYW